MVQFGNRLIFVFKNFHSLLMICYTSVKIKSRHFCDEKIHTVKTKRCYTQSLFAVSQEVVRVQYFVRENIDLCTSKMELWMNVNAV